MVMALSLPDARQLSDEVLAALRLRALRGCELGFCEAEVAELLGVARETVSRCYAAYRRRRATGRVARARAGRAGAVGRPPPQTRGAQLRPRVGAPLPRGAALPAPHRPPPCRAGVDRPDLRHPLAGADGGRLPEAVGI